MKNVTISEPVAKYLAAILLDPKQFKASGQMADYAKNHLLVSVFGVNAPHVDPSDAGPLVYEAMRETVWREAR
jgi:hypothetical protein